MEEPQGEFQGSFVPSASPLVQSRLSPLEKIKTYGLKKLLLMCVGIGIGLGIGVIAASTSLASYLSRQQSARLAEMEQPVPATQWPELELHALGLRATLKTEWDFPSGVRYQFMVAPRSKEFIGPFDSAVRSSSGTISFTLHLYDKGGFELCNEFVMPTRVVSADGRIAAMHANGSFYCTRSDYTHVDHWSLGYVFPKFSPVEAPK